MNKKGWLIIGVIVLVSIGIYDSVSLGPAGDNMDDIILSGTGSECEGLALCECISQANNNEAACLYRCFEQGVSGFCAVQCTLTAKIERAFCYITKSESSADTNGEDNSEAICCAVSEENTCGDEEDTLCGGALCQGDDCEDLCGDGNLFYTGCCCAGGEDSEDSGPTSDSRCKDKLDQCECHAEVNNMEAACFYRCHEQGISKESQKCFDDCRDDAVEAHEFLCGNGGPISPGEKSCSAGTIDCMTELETCCLTGSGKTCGEDDTDCTCQKCPVLDTSCTNPGGDTYCSNLYNHPNEGISCCINEQCQPCPPPECQTDADCTLQPPYGCCCPEGTENHGLCMGPCILCNPPQDE